MLLAFSLVTSSTPQTGRLTICPVELTQGPKRPSQRLARPTSATALLLIAIHTASKDSHGKENSEERIPCTKSRRVGLVTVAGCKVGIATHFVFVGQFIKQPHSQNWASNVPPANSDPCLASFILLLMTMMNNFQHRAHREL